jgi:hypothetical protein
VTPSSKVVQLNAREAAARADKSLPPVLHAVHGQAQKHLRELLQELFNNADDALFEMADRSRNDSDQNLFFDSMRQLRLHRSQILTEFYEFFSNNFESLYNEPDFNSTDDAMDVDAPEQALSLLQNEDLEMSVAVSGIVSKVTSQFSLQITQLTRRLDAVCARTSVTERRNPLGPYRLADAFVEATRKVEIHIKVRIILLKLFERFVMERLGSCYDAANRTLADAGVLTDLGTLKRRSSPTRESAQEARRGTTVSVDFSVLQELLSNARAPGTQSGPGAPGSPAGHRASGPICSTPELVAMLSAVQTGFGAEPIDMDHAPATVNLGQLLAGHAGVAGGRFGGFAPNDEDAVNLIGMLFDYILNDRNLAIPMKALIGRLQIPMLKVAILDKSFFSKSSHPARQLLNELSSVGIGWSGGAELKRDALYNKIEAVVVRVLNNFQDDFQLFESLVAELRAFVRQDHQRTEKVELRVREAEAGKAKTVAAKQSVQQVINQKASGLRLPTAVSRFISGTWSRVLVYLSVKHGSESREWTDAVETLDELLWSMQPLDNTADIVQRERISEPLLQRIEQGMAHVSLPPNEAAQALAALQEALEEISGYDRSYLEDQNVPEPARSVMDDIVLTTPEEVPGHDDDQPSEPELVAQINRIVEGVWVEFADAEGEKLRCKVAAIFQPGNRYIFVNRRGMKVRELARMALAVEIKNQTLTVLEESQVFDRALEAVIGNLRQLHRQAPR